ncbi:MerR family transcriptional regulator [Xanthobacter flavus]|uniref:HTH merR-type domain-containing protein n=1 Tax=Xanthobacter flavus TaxID=281 RepID=A0A9W6CQG9_XANFL|nr:hypothetical protein XFLAVUS301_30960 [Xanthobacter flavus]
MIKAHDAEADHHGSEGSGSQPRLYTTRQLGRLVGMHPNTIKGFLKEGWLHEPCRTPGGHRRFDETHVAAILGRYRTLHEPPSPPPKPPEAPPTPEELEARRFIRARLLEFIAAREKRAAARRPR